MTVRASTAVAALAILALLAGAIATVPSAADAQTPTPTENATVSPDTVRLHVTVQDDGTAQWHVEYRLVLENDAQIEAFESLQNDVEKNPEDYTSEFLDTLSPAVDRAANKTGRSMELRNASVSTKKQALARPTGVVVYRFEWTNFADVSGDGMRIGDALSGFYVNEDTTLRIEWPSGYALESVTPSSDDRSDRAVIWHGPTDFGGDEPRLVLTPTSPLDVPLPVAAAVLFTVVATLGIAVRVRSGSSESDGDAEVAATADAVGGAESDSESDPSVPPELMSNEERVLTTLEENDGRMKQQELAEELDWGAPKMSRVVGDLREEEKVEVFRLGRENVVTLPEEELL